MIDINTYINPTVDTWKTLSERCRVSEGEIDGVVKRILDEVRLGGDAALADIVARIDGFVPPCFELSISDRMTIAEKVPENVKTAILNAKANIEAFHAAQLPVEVKVETMPGVLCMQRSVPIRRVGIYIPGGKAPLFSTVLMLAIPAKIAGCQQIILCTPANREGYVSPEIIYAADICGVDRVFTIGGAQAIAAMAYGTESIPKADKIFGPGNRYVTKAKQIVGSESVAIDMPAGPSEVMVLADSSASPAFVAADFLSQAEHGDDSQAMLVCDSQQIADAVKAEIGNQLESLNRTGIIMHSLANSRIVVFDGIDSRDKITQFADVYAPEHLIISMRQPWQIADRISAAGSVFIGNYSPESAGDYASGTNHTLPTSGWATAYSGVNIDSYMRKITYQQLGVDGLSSLASTIITMAEAEGLDAHANAVRVRMKGGAL